jgi:hypothetical protein
MLSDSDLFMGTSSAFDETAECGLGGFFDVNVALGPKMDLRGGHGLSGRRL